MIWCTRQPLPNCRLNLGSLFVRKTYKDRRCLRVLPSWWRGKGDFSIGAGFLGARWYLIAEAKRGVYVRAVGAGQEMVCQQEVPGHRM